MLSSVDQRRKKTKGVGAGPVQGKREEREMAAWAEIGKRGLISLDLFYYLFFCSLFN